MRKKTVSLLRHKPQINRVSAEQGAVFPSTGVAAKAGHLPRVPDGSFQPWENPGLQRGPTVATP